jgi:hypothetical protein
MDKEMKRVRKSTVIRRERKKMLKRKRKFDRYGEIEIEKKSSERKRKFDRNGEMEIEKKY